MKKTARPRKTPTQARSQVTCEAIVRAAELVLEEHGADGLTTTRVAKKAGVSVGSLYQYFPHKDALVAALVERYMLQLREAFLQALQLGGALPLDILIEGLLRMLAMTMRAQGRGVHRPLLDQFSAVGLARMAEANLEHYIAALSSHLAQRKDVACRNLQQVSFIMVHAGNGIGAAMAVRDDASQDEAIIKDLARMYLLLLRTPDAPTAV
jgi:AcrR family transcriptional regulator